MLESEDEVASSAAFMVEAMHEVRDEPTVVLRKHPRSRPVMVEGEVTTHLTVLKGQHHGQVVELRRGETVVGRGQGVDLHLNDRGVSRQHARITVDARGSVELVDLGSTNGTFVNGARIHRESLRVGDRIRVGLDAVLEVGHAPLRTAPLAPTAGREHDAPVARKQRISPARRTFEINPPPAMESTAEAAARGPTETTLEAYARLLDIRRRRLGDHHPAVAEMLETMGTALQDDGQLEGALQHLARALEIFQSQQPSAPRATARVLAHMAKIELMLARPHAAAVRLEAAEQLLGTAAASPEELGRVRLLLAQALWGQGGDPARTVALARLARDAFADGGNATRMLHHEAQAWINSVGGRLAGDRPS